MTFEDVFGVASTDGIDLFVDVLVEFGGVWSGQIRVEVSNLTCFSVIAVQM